MQAFAGIEPFVHVAEQRSFRGAARRLGVTPAAVSKAVAKLEAELGVRLLNRTTRDVSLTPEGEIVLRHGREALDRLQAARDLVSLQAQVAQGTLRVSLSFVVGATMVRALERLLRRYPRLDVHLGFDDRPVNLVEEEVDVALRFGALEESNLVARRLRSPRWATVASPGYLAVHGEPQTPDELAAHACLHFVMPTGTVADWRFAGADGPRVVRPAGRLRLDRGDLLAGAAAAGLGLAQVFDFMVDEDLRRGDLVEVLRPWSAEGPPFHALCLPGRQRVPKVRAFMDFVAEIFGPHGSER